MRTKGSYIAKVLLKVHLPYYYGNNTADTVPYKLKTLPILCIIINTDVHTMSGTHWLALIKYQNRSIFLARCNFLIML